MSGDGTRVLTTEVRAARAVVVSVLGLVLAASAATACKSAGRDESARVAAAAPTEPGNRTGTLRGVDEPTSEEKAPETEPSAAPSGTEAPPQEQSAPAQRMIVYHAWLRLAVHLVEETLAKIDALAERLGGYVESSTLEQRVLRIPVASYQAAVGELKGLGEVREFRESTWDITEKYQNLEARIDNLRALRARFQVLLSQARTMEERLAIERELRRIELELRVLEEEQRFLADQAAFATITVNVQPIATETAIKDRKPQPFGWVESYGPEKLFWR
jgi:hypothetical protein